MTPLIIESLKLLVSGYIAIAKANGATEEEIDAIFKEEKAKFNINSPDKLEDLK